MLYQLSYLGTARREGRGAPVYSQAGRRCPPGFAFGFAGDGPASHRAAKWLGNHGDGAAGIHGGPNAGRMSEARTHRLHCMGRFRCAANRRLRRRPAAGDGVGAGQPAVQVDVAAALGAERPRGLGRPACRRSGSFLAPAWPGRPVWAAQLALSQPKRIGKPSPPSSVIGLVQRQADDVGVGADHLDHETSRRCPAPHSRRPCRAIRRSRYRPGCRPR